MSDENNLDEAKQALWRKGILSWKLHEAQLEMYDAVNNSTSSIFVINCGRQIGKSFFLCAFAIEKALKTPGIKICYVAPQAKMVKQIILPRIKEILKDCPRDMKPDYKVNEQIYVFPNGSEISIAGTDSERAENIRGRVFHWIICDEAGFMDKLDYVLSSILVPTISTTKGRIILSSTPPVSSDHAFVRLARDAEAGGYYVKKTVFENPLIDKSQIEELKKLSGGEESDAWHREYLAEFVTSQEYAIFPEATEEQMAKLVKEWPRPLYYDSYTSVDLGYTDNTGFLFAYWDFLNNKLIIEGEELYNKPNSDQIAETVRVNEAALWTFNGTCKEPFKRIIDGNDITISDINKPPHNLRFVKTRNDDPMSAVNEVRIMLQDGKIIFNPRCKRTILQVKSGVWDNQKKKFARSESQGHYDLIAALIYLVRNLAKSKNPYPPGLGLDISTMHFNPDILKGPKSNAVNQLTKVFLDPSKKFFKNDGN